MSISSRAVTLVGAGTQGRRLAFMWSRSGRPVYLVDQNGKQLSQAKDYIQKLRSSFPLAQTGTWGDITTLKPENLSEAAANSWLFVECVPEIPALKRKLLQELDVLTPPETIIASNSSSYTISQILKDVNLRHYERFVSMHSYWPPETSAIEILGSDQTKPEIIPLLMEETRKHGFQPFHVRKESTGYIYNRIWAAIKRETLLILSEDVATPGEIDAIFKDILKTPKGPCEQMDVVGLDVVCDIEEHYADVRPGIPGEPRELLRRMISEKKLGVKTGSGFFQYDENK